ncbi:MAG: 3-hydroxyacyl-CoA dehydrogenase family protein [Candidatus Thalassarchaeaceae archaeon]|nr:3-hydroxyacyl-CoA dehydrogenase family protein [Candidatus Thalassarchaeaceae archaeon]
MSIRTVAIIGAGTMGAGIAQVCAQTGYKTNLFDAFPEGLEKGMEVINDFWEKGIARGKTTPEQKAKWSQNVQAVSDLKGAVSNADLVIEAVPEIPELKHRIFVDLHKYAPPHCILATNTSGLSITDIANASGRSDKVIGMHFFNPVPIMKLLELIRADTTSDETAALAESIGKAMGKTTIMVNDIAGFATSRLGVVLGNEAIRMLAEGVASASDIDTAMTLGYRHPMGPLELTDLVGLDVRHHILENLAKAHDDDRYIPHPLLSALVKAGDLGKKSGSGIYNWKSGEKQNRDDLPL